MKGGEGGDEKFDLSLRLDGISRDLLQNPCSKGIKREAVEEEDEIELSLGLSLNGRFGVDPSSKKFKRSSSLANLMFTEESSCSNATHLVNESELLRTRSLPTAAEEEWRRRKEWHTMRRLEARKKRMEKLKNTRAMKDNGNGNGLHEPMLESGGFAMISSDGSSETPSSCSSGASDLPGNGSKQQDSGLQQQKDRNKSEILVDGDADKSFREMPYVSTKGVGVNRVGGFLYRYKKGEEVRIVCVCHGLFLSPAEFVKHGGGGDVEHPLKHIVVNPYPLL